jgi:hypothetical protein
VNRPKRAPVFSRLDPAKENRKTDALLAAADRWAKAMGEVLSELTPAAAEFAAGAFLTEHPGADAKHVVRVYQRAARLETARVTKKRNRYLDCRIQIVTPVGQSTFNLLTHEQSTTWSWRRTACRVPLFSLDDREYGLCRSCKRDALDPEKLYQRAPNPGAGVTHTEITEERAAELLALPSWTTPNT